MTSCQRSVSPHYHGNWMTQEFVKCQISTMRPCLPVLPCLPVYSSVCQSLCVLHCHDEGHPCIGIKSCANTQLPKPKDKLFFLRAQTHTHTHTEHTHYLCKHSMHAEGCAWKWPLWGPASLSPPISAKDKRAQ